MEIVAMNNELQPIAHKFLDLIEGCVIEEEILANASVILDNNQIIGMMSFEQFGYIGLIRYFIFKKSIDSTLTIDLLNHVIQNAKAHHIDKLISIVSNQEVEEVFKLLGFQECDKNNIYIDETIFSNTEYKNSKVYILHL